MMFIIQQGHFLYLWLKYATLRTIIASEEDGLLLTERPKITVNWETVDCFKMFSLFLSFVFIYLNP